MQKHDLVKIDCGKTLASAQPRWTGKAEIAVGLTMVAVGVENNSVLESKLLNNKRATPTAMVPKATFMPLSSIVYIGRGREMEKTQAGPMTNLTTQYDHPI